MSSMVGWRQRGLGAAGLALASVVALVIGCEGDAGPVGPAGVGDVGAKGDPGPPGGPQGDPSINGIVPGTVYLDRTVEVSISGFATSWSKSSIDATSLDFGAGITVESVVVASGGALVANVTIAPEATTGARDVTVDGLTYAGAFRVEPPVSVEVLQDPSTVLQGSVVRARIEQRDKSTPFHPGGLKVEAFGSEAHFVSDVTNYSALVDFRVDVTAPAGPTAVQVIDTSLFTQATNSLTNGGLDILARSPEAPPTGPVTVTTARESHLYEVTTTGLSLVNMSLGIDAVAFPNSQAAIFVLPESGLFADQLITAGAFVANTAGTYYVIVQDVGEEVGYDFDLTLDVLPINPVPLMLGTPTPGDISTAGEVDFYSVNVGPAPFGVGLFEGFTSTCFPSPTQMMAEVAVFDASFTPIFLESFAQCSFIGAPPFFGPGTFYVAVRGSELQGCNGCTFDYTVVVDTL